jgi:hypothetical protein
MGYTFGAVELATKKFGKIVDDKGKNFEVLWTTGEISKCSQPEVRKVILNSPLFFSLIQPERNQDLFDSNPLQLLKEILWEARCQAEEIASRAADSKASSNKRLGATSTIDLKRTVLSFGVAEAIWDKTWNKTRKAMLSPASKIGADGPLYWLSDAEFEVTSPIVVEWGNLSSAEKTDPLAETPANSDATTVEPVKSRQPSKKVGKTPVEVVPVDANDPWSQFLSLLENRGIRKAPLFLAAGELLDLISALEQQFKLLDTSSMKKVTEALARTKSEHAYLVGCTLTSTQVELGRKIAQSAQSLAVASIQWASSQAEALTVVQRVALSKILLTSPTTATSSQIEDSEYGKVCALVLSLTSPELTSVKDATVSELAKRIKSQPSQTLAYLPLVFEALPWGKVQRQRLTEVLIKQQSSAIKDQDFWQGLDVASLIWLEKVDGWDLLVNRPSSRAVIQGGLEQTLASMSPQACLDALPKLELIGRVAGEESVTGLVLRALKANKHTQSALSKMSKESELDALQGALKASRSSLAESLERFEDTERRTSELVAQVEALNAKLEAAGDQVVTMRENEKLQYELDAAKTLARMLSTLDNELGPDYQGRDRVVSQSGRLGISQVFAAGDTETFAPTTCDDPEDTAADGDLVKIIASGFKWSGGDQSVVLVKALVAKI